MSPETTIFQTPSISVGSSVGRYHYYTLGNPPLTRLQDRSGTLVIRTGDPPTHSECRGTLRMSLWERGSGEGSTENGLSVSLAPIIGEYEYRTHWMPPTVYFTSDLVTKSHSYRVRMITNRLCV